MTTTMNKLHDLLDEMEESGVLEDRREYTREDLKKGYDLTDEEASDLYFLVQRQFTTDPNPYNLMEEYRKDPKVGAWVIEYIVEAIHNSFDGAGNEHDRIIVEQTFCDIALWVKECVKRQKGLTT